MRRSSPHASLDSDFIVTLRNIGVSFPFFDYINFFYHASVTLKISKFYKTINQSRKKFQHIFDE